MTRRGRAGRRERGNGGGGEGKKRGRGENNGQIKGGGKREKRRKGEACMLTAEREGRPYSVSTT